MEACEVLGLFLGIVGVAWMIAAEWRSLMKQAEKAQKVSSGVGALADGSAIEKLIELLKELAKGLPKRVVPGAFLVVAAMILLIACK